MHAVQFVYLFQVINKELGLMINLLHYTIPVHLNHYWKVSFEIFWLVESAEEAVVVLGYSLLLGTRNWEDRPHHCFNSFTLITNTKLTTGSRPRRILDRASNSGCVSSSNRLLSQGSSGPAASQRKYCSNSSFKCSAFLLKVVKFVKATAPRIT